MQMVFQWDRESIPATVTGERWVTTVDEVDAFLDELTTTADANGIPTGAILSLEPGSEDPALMVIVGADRVPLYWLPTDSLSRGDETEDQAPTFEFLMGGHGEFPAWSLIPLEQAREAARRFLTSGGQCPDNITWHPEGAHSAA